MTFTPKDPGISRFNIPDLDEMTTLLAEDAFSSDLIFLGGDLAPATLLNGYRSGIFPMPVDDNQIGWFCPQKRGVFLLYGENDKQSPMKISRSLRKSLRKFNYSIDLAFEQVITGCADPARPGGWITPQIQEAYSELFRLGWAHSIEAWIIEDNCRVLAGGLYGISIGGLFAGESMFHSRTDGSKAALYALTSQMAKSGGLLVDAQWQTSHLQSLGAIELPRLDYLDLLKQALSMPLPNLFKLGPRDLDLPTL